MRKVLLVGDRLFMKYPDLDYFSQRTAEANAEIVSTRGMNREQMLAAASDAVAIAVVGAPIDRELIYAMREPRFIMTLSVGYDVVDLAAANERGIPVSNCPLYCSEEVADHALTLLMAVTRRIHTIMPYTQKGDWEYERYRAIRSFAEQTLGIVGLGRIGRHLARKAAAIGYTVQAYDPYVDDDLFETLGVQRVYDLQPFLQSSDAISLHAPLTDETYHMIDREALSHVQPHCVLVNTARGRLIDQDALVEALRAGTIAGAGIDVLRVEPPETDNPLLREPNVIVTPHIAWYTERSHRRNIEQGMDEMVRVLNGFRPRHIVNPEVLSRRRSQ